MKTPDLKIAKNRLIVAEAIIVDDAFQQKKAAESGLTQEKLANELGVTQGVIGQWFAGFTKIPDKRLIWLSNRLDFDPLTVRNTLIDYSFDIQEPSPAYNSQAPIVGNAQLGPEGYWQAMDYPPGHGDGFIPVPSTDPDVYALRVKGDSMAPAIRHGWTVVIEPNAEIHPGEFVLVCTTDERCMIKELRFERDNEYTFGNINDDYPAITVDKTNITRLHPVAFIAPPSRAKA